MARVNDQALKGSSLEGVHIPESLTTAVTAAIQERLDRVRRQNDRELTSRLLAIGRDAAAHLKEPYRSADHAHLLYDERGLPR